MIDLKTERDPEVLRQVALLLEAENRELHRRLKKLTTELANAKGDDEKAQLSLELKYLQELLDNRNRKLFGMSSERRPRDGDANADDKTSKKPKKGHGPRKQTELPIVEMFHDLDEADKIQDRLLGAIPLFSGLDVDSSVSIPFFKALSRKPYTGPGDRPAFTVALLKEALRLQGHPITSVTKRPCPPLTHEQADLVRKTMEELGWG